jgi:hypothetical protein
VWSGQDIGCAVTGLAGLQCAFELRREECDIFDLGMSTKCGENDTTTGFARVGASA